MSCSDGQSHMSFTYNLSGSMRDDCKCFGPIEFDAVLKINDVDDLEMSQLFYHQEKANGSHCVTL